MHELAKDFTVSIIEYFRNKHPDDEDALKYYSKYLARDKRVRLLNDAKSVSPVSVQKFDKQPTLINCQNCTVNLITGDSYKHDPLDYLTKIPNVWFDPAAKSEDFDKFISSIMQDDPELINYLQRALGYSISGMFFHYIRSYNQKWKRNFEQYNNGNVG